MKWLVGGLVIWNILLALRLFHIGRIIDEIQLTSYAFASAVGQRDLYERIWKEVITKEWGGFANERVVRTAERTGSAERKDGPGGVEDQGVQDSDHPAG